jgi:hypothetical protein
VEADCRQHETGCGEQHCESGAGDIYYYDSFNCVVLVVVVVFVMFVILFWYFDF